MQSVILAAGNSTRTYPLTLTRPKPLLKAANKTILEYNLESIKEISDEIILVVGYKKNFIIDFIRKNYNSLNIKFIEQKEQLGTGHAVSMLEGSIKEKFLLLMGDNIYSKEDILKASKQKYSILVKKVKNPELFGVVTEKDNMLKDITEKPKNPDSNLVSCALYSLDKNIFDAIKKIKKSERNEYELTDAIKLISKEAPVYCIHSSSCLQISYPSDLLEADKELRNGKNMIGKGSKILGKVENSSIGSNCLIKGSVKNSIIMDNSMIDENSVIENSIIGEEVYFRGIVKAENLGAIIGDNVKAEDVNISQGCRIWPNRIIKGEIKHDVN